MTLSTITRSFDGRSYETDAILGIMDVLKANRLFLESMTQVVKKALSSQSFLSRLLGYRYDEAAACSELKLSSIRLSVHIYDAAYSVERGLSPSELKIYLVAAAKLLNERLGDRCSTPRSMVIVKAIYETVLKKHLVYPLEDLSVQDLSPSYISSKTAELFTCFGEGLSKEQISELLLRTIARTAKFVERIKALVSNSTKSRGEKKAFLAKEMREKTVWLLSQRSTLLLRAKKLQDKSLRLKADHAAMHLKIFNRYCLLYGALRSLVHTRMDLGLLFLPYFESSEEYDEFFSSETSITDMVLSEQFSQFVQWLNKQTTLGVLNITLNGGVKVRLRDFLHTLSIQSLAFFKTQKACVLLKAELSSIVGEAASRDASSDSLVISRDSQIGRLNMELGDFATGEITEERLLSAAEERLVFLEELLPRLIDMATSS